MARSSRRQLIVLVVLVAVLAAVLLWNRQPGVAIPVAGTAAPVRGTPARAGETPPAEVRLGALDDPRAEPGAGQRNPFEFRRGAPDSARPMAGGPQPFAGPPAPVGEGPAAPSGPPPIRLKFIGIVDPASSGRLAVLSDGRDVFYGREGDTLEGRYRILRIGLESVELARLDGTGRQVLRMSGS